LLLVYDLYAPVVLIQVGLLVLVVVFWVWLQVWPVLR